MPPVRRERATGGRGLQEGQDPQDSVQQNEQEREEAQRRQAQDEQKRSQEGQDEGGSSEQGAGKYNLGPRSTSGTLVINDKEVTMHGEPVELTEEEVKAAKKLDGIHLKQVKDDQDDGE